MQATETTKFTPGNKEGTDSDHVSLSVLNLALATILCVLFLT